MTAGHFVSLEKNLYPFNQKDMQRRVAKNRIPIFENNWKTRNSKGKVG